MNHIPALSQDVSEQPYSPDEIDPRIYDLYDEFCHSAMDRRTFLARAAALGIVGGLAMATSLLPRYAEAAMVKLLTQELQVMGRKVGNDQFPAGLQNAKRFGHGAGRIIEKMQHLMQDDHIR